MTLPPIEEIVPHRGAATLLHEVVSWEPQSIRCLAIVGDGFPYLKEGRARAAVTLELMAQAVAAYAGFASRSRGSSIRRGYVARVRDMHLHVSHVTAGDTLEVSAEAEHATKDLAMFRCRVTFAGDPVANATLAVVLERREGGEAE